MKFCAVLLAVAAAQQAAAGRFIVPNNPDLKITTRRTIDLPNSTVETEIIHLKGARQRREWIWSGCYGCVAGEVRLRNVWSNFCEQPTCCSKAGALE